jgi:hypothetical protein
LDLAAENLLESILRKRRECKNAHPIPNESAPDVEEEEERIDPIFSVAGLIDDNEEQIIEYLLKFNWAELQQLYELFTIASSECQCEAASVNWDPWNCFFCQKSDFHSE